MSFFFYLAAALLIKQSCVAETLLMRLSAQTRLCSESATSLFTI